MIVQLLGDYAQELGLVFVSVVVRGAYADQLGRDTRAEHRGGISLRLVREQKQKLGYSWWENRGLEMLTVM